MDLSKISTDAAGIFSLADLLAKVEVATNSSVSLLLGHFTNRPNQIPPESDWFFESGGSASFFEVIGWVDLHYPCAGPRKVFVRMNLPSEHHSFDRITLIINALYCLFSIPPDALSIVYYFTVDNLCCLLPNDEFGRG